MLRATTHRSSHVDRDRSPLPTVTESCDVVLLERASTLNTGSAAAEIRDFEHKASKAKLPLTKMELKRL